MACCNVVEELVAMEFAGALAVFAGEGEAELVCRLGDDLGDFDWLALLLLLLVVLVACWEVIELLAVVDFVGALAALAEDDFKFVCDAEMAMGVFSCWLVVEVLLCRGLLHTGFAGALVVWRPTRLPCLGL